MENKEQDYAKTTFDEVAKNYDEIPFFKTSAVHVAQMIEKHTKLRTLEVLDVACGTGNVVLECASRLNEATFDAIDISEGMLAIAKEKATEQKLDNIDFHLQDVTKLDMGKKYHVITCAYALFFLPDPIAVLKSLVAHLRPNGIVIFTTFTAEAFSPSSEILLPLLVQYGSPSAKEYDVDSWKNLKHKKDIERLCQMALVGDVNVQTKDIRYGLSVDEWWELMNNTGFKGMLLELSAEDYEQVKTEYYQAMLAHADMDGEVELIADSNFVVVDR
jgi:ubiquinone/menaquinone biosynthesis C-methylase UbiE